MLSTELVPIAKVSKHIVAQVPEPVYNTFVNPENINSTLDFPLENYSDNVYSDINLGNTTTEKYNISVSESIVYGAEMLKEMDIGLNVNGIQLPCNKQYFEFLQKSDPAQAVPLTLSDGCGIGHLIQPGICGFDTDIINAMIQSNTLFVGKDGTQMTRQSTPTLVDIARRQIPPSVLYDPRFKGQLHPNTFNPWKKQRLNKRWRCLPFRPTVFRLTPPPAQSANVPAAIGDIAAYVVQRSDYMSARQLDIGNYLTLDDINSMKDNPYSLDKRGQIFKDCVYTYTKALASYNYEIIAKADDEYITFKPSDQQSTTLYELKVGDYSFPTNISNPELIIAYGLDPMMFIWHYDQIPLAWKASAVGTWDKDAFKEPDGQSLSVSVKFNKIMSPLLNPILNNEQKQSIAQCNYLTLDIQYGGEINKLFKFFATPGLRTKTLDPLKFSEDVIYGSGDVKDKYNYGNHTVVLSGPNNNEKRIYIAQYKLGMLEPYVKKVQQIPYISEESVQTQFTAVKKSKNNTANSNMKVQFEDRKITVNSQNIGACIPRYLLVFVQTTLSYYIKSMSIKLNAGANTQLARMSTLAKYTVENGVINYDASSDMTGYSILDNQHCQVSMMPGTKALSTIHANGTILLLKFGTDITLPYGLVPGMTGMDTTIQYEFDIGFHDEDILWKMDDITDLNCILYTTHLVEGDLIISNARTSTNRDLINPVILAQALDDTKAKIEGNQLFSSKRTMYSGGSFFNTLAKAKNAYLKVAPWLSVAHRAIEHNRDFIEKEKKNSNSALSRYLS